MADTMDMDTLVKKVKQTDIWKAIWNTITCAAVAYKNRFHTAKASRQSHKCLVAQKWIINT